MAVKPTKKLFAVVELGGTQELVTLGEKIETDRVDTETEKQLVCDKVLLLVNDLKVNVGNPYVKGTTVTFKVLEHKKDKKIKIIKFKSKSRYRRTTGHRQPISILEVVKIGDAVAVKAEAKVKPKKVKVVKKVSKKR